MKRSVLFTLTVLLLLIVGIVWSTFSNKLEITKKSADVRNERFGYFFDESGIYLGTDSIPGYRIYVIRTSRDSFFNEESVIPGLAISDSLAAWAKMQILAYSGDASYFKANTFIYNYFQPIITSDAVRKEMIRIVEKDTAQNATDVTRRTEYGGKVDSNNRVIEDTTYSLESKRNGLITIQISVSGKDKYEFHSHPSGKMKIRIRTYYYYQPPSNTDIAEVNNRTGYVFGRLDKTLYIYNYMGVLATFPVQSFISLESMLPPGKIQNITR